MSVLIENNCLSAIRSFLKVKSKKVVIKINMVSAHNELSMTPKNCIRDLINYLRNELSFSGKIIIAEGPAIGTMSEGLRKLGLIEMKKEYDLEFLDIHEDDSIDIPIFDSKFNEFYIPISRTLVESDFVISACRAKTHDTVITTLSIKNIAVGGIVGRSNRPKIHKGYKAINANIAILGGIMYPTFSIVDGEIGMEGNGPVSGSMKKWGYVFAGDNPLEVDSLVSYLMGFDPSSIGYLYYLSKLGYGRLDVSQDINYDLSKIRTRFKPHRTYREQLNWRLDPEEEKHVIERIGNIIEKYRRKHVQ